MKFGAFRDYAINTLGAEYVATGHYARLLYSSQHNDIRSFSPFSLEPSSTSLNITSTSSTTLQSSLTSSIPISPSIHGDPTISSSTPRLVSSVDRCKDQTYFLSRVFDGRFDQVLFPVGHLRKPVIRAIAKKFQLPIADKRDSVGKFKHTYPFLVIFILFFLSSITSPSIEVSLRHLLVF